MLHLAVALLGAQGGKTHVKLFNVLVFLEKIGAAIEDDAAVFHDVAVMGNAQGDAHILLYQQDRSLLLGIEPFNDIIKRFNTEQKTSVLLVEQNVRIALSIAHYGYVMENGRVVLDGSA